MRVHPARASPESCTGRIRDMHQEVLGVWMDVMLAYLCVEAAEDLHRPGLRYVHDSAHLFVSLVIPFKIKFC